MFGRVPHRLARLANLRIPRLEVVHPTARGRTRGRERNQAHVAGVLGSWSEGHCRPLKATEGAARLVPRGTAQNEEDLWRNIF